MSSENPVAKLPLNPRGWKIDWTGFAINILLPFAGVVVALLLGAIMLLFLKVNPLDAYAAIFAGAFGNTSGIIQSLVKATDLLLVGLGICIAFRASVINIGGEGQIILGAIAGTWWTLTFRTWSPWLVVPGALVMGFIAGAFWGFIPGILKARFNVNEILSTIMMNAIALQLMNLLLAGPLMDPNGVSSGTFLAQSERIPDALWLPRLIPQTLFNAGAILAVVLAVAVYFFLWRTTIGYRIRAVGLNPDASRFAGINVRFYQALSLTLAGGFAGLAGVVEVTGVQHRLLEGITGGYGFTGIVAALFGGLHPLGMIPASFLFGGLLVGGDKMQRAIQVPSALTTAILGLVVMFVSGSALFARRWSAHRHLNALKEEGGNL
jgi:general nucleoside transport system permease protein